MSDWRDLPVVAPPPQKDWRSLPVAAAGGESWVDDFTPSTPSFDVTGKAGTIARGLGKGALFNFADEIAGGLGGLEAVISRYGMDALKTPTGRRIVRAVSGAPAAMPDSMVDAMLEQSGQESQRLVNDSVPTQENTFHNAYVASRDVNRSEAKRAAAARPKLMMASELAGALAMPTPGGVVTKALGPATKLNAYGHAASGFLQGTAMGAGDSEKDTAGGVLGDALMVGGVGGVVGGAGSKAAEWGGNALKTGLENRSYINALKAVGLSSGIINQLKKIGIENGDDAYELGRKLLAMGRDDLATEKLVKAGSTPADAYKAAQALKELYGPMVSDAISRADMAGSANYGEAGAKMAKAVFGDADRIKLRDSGPAENMIRDVMSQGVDTPGSFKALQALKTSGDKSINRLSTDMTQTQQRKAIDALRGNIVKQVGDVAGDDIGGQLSMANQKLSTLHDVTALSANETTREMARKFGSGWTMPTLAGTTAAATSGSAGTGLGAAALMWGVGKAGKLAAPYMPAIAATTQNSLAPAMPGLTAGAVNAPTRLAMQKLAEYLGVAPKSKDEMATQHLLESSTSPEYQARDGGAE